MVKKVLIFLSYLLVAAAAAATALFLYGNKYSKLDELEAMISERFIGEVDTVAIENAAANAMVNELGDRWSHYIPASEYEAYREQVSNSYVGIGITILTQDEGILIQSVSKGGPAAEAGILPGDYLIGVEGQSTEGMTTTEIRNIVRGPEHTMVNISVQREERTLELAVERRQLELAVATGKMVTDHIGLVTIENFDSRCAAESIAAIESLLEQGAEKLIFDVRNNPGGYADELVKLLDYLLPEGELFRTIDYRGVENVDKSDAKYLDIPMAVLVNAKSYSAAEFFCAAMVEYEAAVSVGEQTCGKGYFQNTFRLSDGSAVGLSVGKYFTPKGVSLAGVGITPDIVVAVDEETDFLISAGIIEPENDPQLQAAIKALQ